MDQSYIELNRASTDRIRALRERLTDEEMQHRVGEHWTVAIALAHLAWWDRRVMYVLDMTEKDNKLFIPEIDIFVNDLSLPLWAAIRHDAARILETSEALDKRLENFRSHYEIYNYNKVARALHRKASDEVDAALKS
jgi:hypothetical protein